MSVFWNFCLYYLTINQRTKTQPRALKFKSKLSRGICFLSWMIFFLKQKLISLVVLNRTWRAKLGIWGHFFLCRDNSSFSLPHPHFRSLKLVLRQSLIPTERRLLDLCHKMLHRSRCWASRRILHSESQEAQGTQPFAQQCHFGEVQAISKERQDPALQLQAHFQSLELQRCQG